MRFSPARPLPLPPVLCVHGLTRNGRDFDYLGAALAGLGREVWCPDLPGRGQSDDLPDPALYAFDQYRRDIVALMARMGASVCDWVGSSMGGLLGMMLATESPSPVRRLVMNDVGPYLQKDPLDRVADYMATSERRFADLRAVELFLRTVYQGYGALTDAQWQAMAEHSARKAAGGYVLAYDPAIGRGMKNVSADIDMWAVYEAVDCPVLVLRGEHSRVLPPETALEMTRRGPKARLAVIPNTAHTPGLMDEAQAKIVADFLDG
jgi:pimeloyl-ACP methyl ester carboxylesterase